MPGTAQGHTVRPSRREDLPALKSIWHELMSMHESSDVSFALARDALNRWQQLVEDMLDRDDTFVLVATRTADRADVPLGFCLGWVARNPPIYKVNEVGFISEVAVAKSAQRQGVGRALMVASQRWFKDRRLTEYQLSTAVWNEPARAFWQAMGGQPLLVRYRFDV